MFNKMFLNHFCLRKAHTKYSIEMEMFNRQQKKNNGWIYAGAINLIFNTLRHRCDRPIAAVNSRDSVIFE